MPVQDTVPTHTVTVPQQAGPVEPPPPAAPAVSRPAGRT